jgi:hypothetical protein
MPVNTKALGYSGLPCFEKALAQAIGIPIFGTPGRDNGSCKRTDAAADCLVDGGDAYGHGTDGLTTY